MALGTKVSKLTKERKCIHLFLFGMSPWSIGRLRTNMNEQRKACPNISSQFCFVITLFIPPTKHKVLSMTNSVNGIMNILAPLKSNFPFIYFSSFTWSTALFVNLKLAFVMPSHFIRTSRLPNSNAVTDFMKNILCSFHHVLIEPLLDTTSYRCWTRDDVYTPANNANHELETCKKKDDGEMFKFIYKTRWWFKYLWK